MNDFEDEPTTIVEATESMLDLVKHCVRCRELREKCECKQISFTEGKEA